MFSSFAALDLAGRVTASQNRARIAWLIGGSSAMGLGIWSMHYIGMLAFSIPMQMSYDAPTVFLSLLAAISASAVALFTVSRKRMGASQVALGSIFMGSGIAVMHYIGMADLRVSARVSYNLWLSHGARRPIRSPPAASQAIARTPRQAHIAERGAVTPICEQEVVENEI